VKKLKLMVIFKKKNYQNLFKKLVYSNMLTIVKWRRKKMAVVLCNDGTCVPPKCPIVDVQEDKVVIGEKENVCTLTIEQFDILKEKVKSGEL